MALNCLLSGWLPELYQDFSQNRWSTPAHLRHKRLQATVQKLQISGKKNIIFSSQTQCICSSQLSPTFVCRHIKDNVYAFEKKRRGKNSSASFEKLIPLLSEFLSFERLNISLQSTAAIIICWKWCRLYSPAAVWFHYFHYLHWFSLLGAHFFLPSPFRAPISFVYISSADFSSARAGRPRATRLLRENSIRLGACY